MNLDRKKIVTLNDVALRAGVSKGTVSVVLNDARTSNHYAEITRKRIRQAASDLGYQPNAIARSLSTRRTNVIALYVGESFMNTRHPVFAEILTGLEEGCIRVKHDLLMHGNLGHESAEADFAEIANGKVDGVVLNIVPDDRLVELLIEARFPMITMIDRIPTLPCVIADVDSGCCLLAAHLMEKGHRRVLYRTPPLPTENIRARTTAFLNAAKAHEIDVISTVSLDWAGGISDEEMAIIKHRGPDRCTAAVGCTDELAHAVCNACDDLGLRIPHDLAVAGYNGVEPPVKPVWRMTTVRAPWTDIGAKAVELLTRIIDGGIVPSETVLPVELVVGNTT